MTAAEPPSPPLTPEQIDTFLRDGILVVDDLLGPERIIEAHRGLARTLKEECDVDVHDLEGTGCNLARVSSTNGAGGVLDIFYPEWKMKIATDETLFGMTCQIWKEAYCHSGETLEDMINGGESSRRNNDGEELENNDGDQGLDDVSFKWHPFGAFDYKKGYMYIDRIGYRIPTELAKRLGKKLATNATIQSKQQNDTSVIATMDVPKKKMSKPRPIQRCLTPHFDCCPETYHDATSKNKWRPIQCFVSLTDNLLPSTGGFEAVPGFHREFRSWSDNGRRQSSYAASTSLTNDDDDEQLQTQQPHPKPCVGEYTHLSPSLDRSIMRRMQHIPVRAGSAVFWDNRIPHGNSYRNDPPPVNNDNDGRNRACDENIIDNAPLVADALGTSGSRAVVYCSFLPDVGANRSFVRRQLEDWKLRRVPRVGDRWIRQDDKNEEENSDGSAGADEAMRVQIDKARTENLSELQSRLIGLVEWT